MRRAFIKPVTAFLAFCAAGFLACGDQPLFDELATNRLKVVIKGTYESNDPRDFLTGVIADDSVDDHTCASTFPTRFMFDVAEIRLNGKKFANYRETYNAGVDDLDPLFTTGIGYSNDDVPNGYYSHVSMYIRKMIFNNASQFERSAGVWIYFKDAETIFAEKTIEGFDFNQLQVNTWYDSLRLEASRVNRIFPLSIPIDGGMIYSKEDGETVLEIRLVIKNFVKKYEYDYTGGLIHYFGLSDWLRDVQADEAHIGGNVIAVARSYVPGKTATISGVGANPNSYVVAIYAENDITDYTLAPSAWDRSSTLSPPKAPVLTNSTDIEARLDYYLQYEVYKEDYNAFAGIVNDETDYELFYAGPWEDYNDGLKSFKIPPLVTYTTTGSFTFTNVPVGRSYRVYNWTAPVGPGELPGRGANFTQIGGLLVINEGDAGSIVNIP